MPQQRPGRLILVNDVVLNIQGFLGVVGKRDEAGQRFLAGGDQTNARQILAAGIRGDNLAQIGGGRIRQRIGMRLVHMPR